MTEPPAPPPAPPPGGQGPDWGDMGRKLQGAQGSDRLILIAGVLFFVDSFLPWYGVSFSVAGFSGPTVNVKGWSAGGLAVLAILFALAATAFAAIRVTGMNVPLGNVNDGMIYLTLGGGAFVFTLLRLLTETSFTKYGLYVALVLSALLAYGGYQKFQSSKA